MMETKGRGKERKEELLYIDLIKEYVKFSNDELHVYETFYEYYRIPEEINVLIGFNDFFLNPDDYRGYIHTFIISLERILSILNKEIKSKYIIQDSQSIGIQFIPYSSFEHIKYSSEKLPEPTIIKSGEYILQNMLELYKTKQNNQITNIEYLLLFGKELKSEIYSSNVVKKIIFKDIPSFIDGVNLIESMKVQL